MPHPDGLPDLFVDRSLGRVQVPRLLREAGLRLTTLAERYGVPADEAVTDERWLEDAGRLGEAVLMKDERIRYRPVEKAAVIEWRVRAFCLARRDLTASAMAETYLSNLDRITAICVEREAGVFVVTQRGVRATDLG